jgi:hypothetical protein
VASLVCGLLLLFSHYGWWFLSLTLSLILFYLLSAEVCADFKLVVIHG